MRLPTADSRTKVLATRSKGWLDDVAFAWCALAIAFNIFMPVSYNAIRFALLGTLVALAVVTFIRHGLIISRSLMIVGLLWTTVVAIGTIVGYVHHAPYQLKVLYFLFAIPALFYFLAHCASERIIRVIFTAGAWATIVIGAYTTLFAAFTRFDIDATALARLTTALGLRVTVDDAGVTALTSFSVSAFAWWGAIWASSLLVTKRDGILPAQWVRVAATAIAFTVVLLSWRRGLILALALTPLIIVFVALVLLYRRQKSTLGSESRIFTRASISKAGAGIIVAIAITGALAVALQPHISYLVKTPAPLVAAASAKPAAASPASASPAVSAAPASPAPAKPAVTNAAKPTPTVKPTSTPRAVSGTLIEKSDSAEIRKNEIKALKPQSVSAAIIGAGVGATIPRDPPRPEVKAFQSELQYNQFFYAHGALGAALAALVIFVGLRTLRRAFSIEQKFAGALFVSIVGSLTLLVANATNPLILVPGQYWPVLLPFMVYFAWLRTKPSGVTTRSTHRLGSLNITVVD